MKTWVFKLLGIIFSFLIIVGCSSSDGKSDQPAQGVSVSKVVIAPSSVLFTTLNSSKLLEATVYDSDGNVISAPVTWTSSHNDIVSISSDGNATAQGTIGSATVTAEVNGVKSKTVLILVAELAGGAITVADNQVIGDITPVDENATLGIGYQYKVRIKDLPLPSAGDIVIGTGSIPIAGEVVSAVQNGPDVDLVLEIIPLDQMFTQLKIDEKTALSPADFVVSDDISKYYDVTRSSNGTLAFSTKEPVPSARKSSPTRSSEFDLGPFNCQTDASINLLQLSMPASIQLTPQVSRNLVYNGSSLQASLTGSLTSEFKFGINLTSSLDAVFTCSSEIARVEFRIAGPFYFAIPLGIGFDVKGQVQLAQLGVEESFKIDQEVEFGIGCTGSDCHEIRDYNFRTGALETKFTIPSTSVANNIHLKPELSSYIDLKLLAGLHIFFNITRDIELIDSQFGLVVAGDFGNIAGQIEDSNYASDYKTSSYTMIQPGSELNLLPIFGPYNLVPPIQESISTDLATSPKPIEVSADKDTYSVGDTVTFKVKLDPTTVNYGFLGYNVDKITIYKRSPDGQGGYEYTPFFDMPATQGQTEFEREWLFTEAGSISGNFYAFVETHWLPTFSDFGILELQKVSVPRLISRTEIYDAFSTLTGRYNYYYNSENILMRRVFEDFSENDFSSTVYYSYDNQGHVNHLSTDYVDPDRSDDESVVVSDQFGNWIYEGVYIDDKLEYYSNTTYTYIDTNVMTQAVFDNYQCDYETCELSSTIIETYQYDNSGKIIQINILYYDGHTDTETFIYEEDLLSEIRLSGGGVYKYYYY